MPRHPFLASLLLTALLSYAAATSSAQTSDSAVSQATLLLRLGSDSGSAVWVASPGNRQIEGRLRRVTDSSLVLGMGDRELILPILASDTVWVRGRATQRGAKVGGTVGLLLIGAVTTLFLVTCRDGTDDPCTGIGGLVPAGLITVGAGGLLGAAVGSLIPQWHRRLP